MLLQLVEGALPVKQVAEKEQRENAETEEGYAERPLVSFRTDKNQGVHEESQTRSKD